MPRISLTTRIKAISAAGGMGFVAAFLPGFGSSQAAIIATTVVGDIGDEGFLTLVGGINTANMVISIATAYILDKARNGAIVTVKNLLEVVNYEMMLLFLGVALISGAIATVLAINISKIFARLVPRIPYRALIWFIISFIAVLSIYFDGIYGFVILAVATSLGVIASEFGVGKNHLMGCLIVPVILYFVL